MSFSSLEDKFADPLTVIADKGLYQSTWFGKSEWRSGAHHACLQHETGPKYPRV